MIRAKKGLITLQHGIGKRRSVIKVLVNEIQKDFEIILRQWQVGSGIGKSVEKKLGVFMRLLAFHTYGELAVGCGGLDGQFSEEKFVGWVRPIWRIERAFYFDPLNDSTTVSFFWHRREVVVESLVCSNERDWQAKKTILK